MCSVRRKYTYLLEPRFIQDLSTWRQSRNLSPEEKGGSNSTAKKAKDGPADLACFVPLEEASQSNRFACFQLCYWQGAPELDGRPCVVEKRLIKESIEACPSQSFCYCIESSTFPIILFIAVYSMLLDWASIDGRGLRGRYLQCQR